MKLPEAVARCVDPSAPEDLRILAAQGLIPLPPAQRLLSLTALFADPSEAVRKAAREAWQALPATFFHDALGASDLPEDVLDAVATFRAEEDTLLHRVLEHPRLGPQTLGRFVDSPSDEILSRVAQNQRVLDRQPELARRLLANASLHPSDRSRLYSRYAPGEDEGPPAGEVPPQEVELPEGLPPELLDDSQDEAKADSSNLYQLVQSLTVAEKIRLATLGSKGARKLLIRDTNKTVITAVVRSPKIREDEIQAIAQERTTPEEVLRLILQRKDWLKNYPIRLALCQNPKTPTPSALRLIETLQERDVRQIAKSRNVPSPVSAAAARSLARRSKH